MSGEEAFTILEKIFEPKHNQKIEEIKGYTIKFLILKHQRATQQKICVKSTRMEEISLLKKY